jgi:hypothetical protein
VSNWLERPAEIGVQRAYDHFFSTMLSFETSCAFLFHIYLRNKLNIKFRQVSMANFPEVNGKKRREGAKAHALARDRRSGGALREQRWACCRTIISLGDSGSDDFSERSDHARRAVRLSQHRRRIDDLPCWISALARCDRPRSKAL